MTLSLKQFVFGISILFSLLACVGIILDLKYNFSKTGIDVIYLVFSSVLTCLIILTKVNIKTVDSNHNVNSKKIILGGILLTLKFMVDLLVDSLILPSLLGLLITVGVILFLVGFKPIAIRLNK
jgi:hypothetical protein